MKKIKEIIKAIDDKLIETDKGYLLLGQANKLLVNKKIISIAENSNKFLKSILEEKKIPHAYQTQNKPRQWRIPLSDEGSKRKKRYEKNKKHQLKLT